MPTSHSYKAFISYSHTDHKRAGWLHRALESYRVPKHLVGTETGLGPVPARLTPVFRDRDELAVSADLTDRIREALIASECLIVICSPAAARSTWVNREIEEFKKLGRSERVLCLIVEGEPSLPGSDDDCYPPALRQRYDQDGKLLDGSAEPIAADLRKSGDGRSLALSKIIAGMIGVGLDDLRRRELQRRQQRMLAITASSVLVAGVMVIMAINAVMARNEADQRRQQAEDLLSFMVDDLRNNLTPIGRLDLLEDVGQQAMEYFATVDLGSLTDGELLKQAQVLTQLGEIRIEQLQYDEALASFQEAYERSAALQRHDPTDGERLFNRSQAEFWVGFVHWRNGSLSDAREWMTRYRNSALELVALDSSRNDWLEEVAYGHHNLAVLNQDSGNLQSAVEGFQREIEIWDTLLARSDGSPRIKRDRADALSYLGNVAVMQGDLLTALEYYEQNAEVIRGLLQNNQDDARWLNDLAFAVQLLAETSALTGDLDTASAYVDEASALFDSLVARDSTNRNWLRASVRPRVTRAQILAARQRWKEALDVIASSVSLLEGMIGEGSADLNVRNQYAHALAVKAWAHHASGEAGPALASVDGALSELEKIEKADRLNDERLGLYASLYAQRGEINLAAGEDDAAAEDWRQAHDLLKEKAPGSQSPFLLDPWVRVLARMDRRSEAGAVSDALHARRYKPLMPWPD
jgi:tetratricopeptide (TPR) repeat protein